MEIDFGQLTIVLYADQTPSAFAVAVSASILRTKAGYGVCFTCNNKLFPRTQENGTKNSLFRSIANTRYPRINFFFYPFRS